MARKLPIDEIQVVPLNEEKTIIPLVEQLNGLIDRYNAIYGIYQKTMFSSNEEQKERLGGVLTNIEKAINALCERITVPFFLLKTNQTVT